jgi:three-Cys-motif partner protein
MPKSSSKQLFDWKEWRSGSFPPLEDHSKAKLDVLRLYIQDYINILCRDTFGKSEFRLTIVDGFAGGGIYHGNEVGSPFVLLEAVKCAEAAINGYRKKQITIDCQYYFVERDKAAAACLKDQLLERGYADEIGKSIFLIEAAFINAQAKIVTAIKQRHSRGGTRALFFLDQCGYTDVPATLLKTISEQLNWKAEYIINFAIDWLTTYVGDSELFARIYSGLDLQSVLPLQEILDAKKNSQVGLEYIIEAKIGPALQTLSGSPFFSPFYIQSPKSHRGYWLLHLAPQARARSAMLDVYWKVANGCLHYGHTGLDMLTYKPDAETTGYLNGIEFGESTKISVQKGLLSDFAREIRDNHSTGIRLKEFIDAYCNRTMANESLILSTLVELAQNGEIDVTGKKGGSKRVDEIDRSDILRPGNSPVLFPVPRNSKK